MWLLDANMDVHLVAISVDLGFPSAAAASLGWKALSNGSLLAAAVGAGFDCLLTRGQLFGESAARAMKAYPQFAVVLIDLPQQQWPLYRDRFLGACSESPIRPIPGQMIRWP
jgi:hypothetical protein